MTLGTIIGKTVFSIRGFRTDGRVKHISPEYILFTDGETYIHLEEQDYYSYHDCSMTARLIEVCVDKVMWNRIRDDLKTYPNANCEI